MREFCIGIGRRLTTGGLTLYNLHPRLYSGFEAPIIVDAASGKCLLRKYGAFESGVEPHMPPLRPLLTAHASLDGGCVPLAFCAAPAGLTAFGRLDAGAVPDAEMSGKLSCSASADAGAVVFAALTEAGTLRVSLDVLAQTVVTAHDAAACLRKQTGGEAAVLSEADARAAAEKNAAGEAGVEASASASGRAARLRKLCEADPIDPAEMDGMTMDELAFIYFD